MAVEASQQILVSYCSPIVPSPRPRRNPHSNTYTTHQTRYPRNIASVFSSQDENAHKPKRKRLKHASNSSPLSNLSSHLIRQQHHTRQRTPSSLCENPRTRLDLPLGQVTYSFFNPIFSRLCKTRIRVYLVQIIALQRWLFSRSS